MRDVLTLIFGCAFLFEALAVIAMSRMLRRSWKRDARWKATVNDLNEVVEAWQQNALKWENIATQWRRIASQRDPSLSVQEVANNG